jgi:hypothetical protein
VSTRLRRIQCSAKSGFASVKKRTLGKIRRRGGGRIVMPVASISGSKELYNRHSDKRVALSVRREINENRNEVAGHY